VAGAPDERGKPGAAAALPRIAQRSGVDGAMPYLPLIRFGATEMPSTTYGIRPARRKLRRKPRGLLALPFILLVAVVIAGAAFVSYVLWPRWPSAPVSPDAPAIPITVAGVAFNVPPGAIRMPVQRTPGPHERIDLAFRWPALTPPLPPAKSANPPRPRDAEGAAPTKAEERLFVTIAGSGLVLPPAERLKSIYPRYVEAQAAAGPEGLAILPFRTGTPYQGEDLVYVVTRPEQFFARCTRAGAGPTPGTCIHERRIETADITLRFPRDWLDDWRGVAAGFDRLVAQLHPRAN
jgi:hypothetical protein